MSTDKSTDALATLGTLLDESAKRDAIHIAVAPAVAGGTLNPGDHVRMMGDLAFKTEINEGVGIVDPYLSSRVKKGQRFWLFIYPRKIQSLRHVWTHPDFPDEVAESKAMCSKAESEAWLREFASRNDCPRYEILLACACGDTVKSQDSDGSYEELSYSNDGDALSFYGRDAHGEIPPEFWDHVENLTGIKDLKRAKWFQCSC